MASLSLSHRRYCFLKHKNYLELEDELEDVWDAKRRSIPGTDISDMFPGVIELRAAGYLVIEEVRGANRDELSEIGLSSQQIDAVFAALEALQ